MTLENETKMFCLKIIGNRSHSDAVSYLTWMESSAVSLKKTWKLAQKWQHYINKKCTLQSNHFTQIYASLCVISGFCHKEAENCDLLGYYTGSTTTHCVITQKSAALMHLCGLRNVNIYMITYICSFDYLPGMQLLHKAKYIYLHFIRCYYTWGMYNWNTFKDSYWWKHCNSQKNFHRYQD